MFAYDYFLDVFKMVPKYDLGDQTHIPVVDNYNTEKSDEKIKSNSIE